MKKMFIIISEKKLVSLFLPHTVKTEDSPAVHTSAPFFFLHFLADPALPWIEQVTKKLHLCPLALRFMVNKTTIRTNMVIALLTNRSYTPLAGAIVAKRFRVSKFFAEMLSRTNTFKNVLACCQ